MINYNYHKYMCNKYKRDKHKAYDDIDILPSTARDESVIKMHEKINLEQKHIVTVDNKLKTCCKDGKQEGIIRNQCAQIESISGELDYK